MPTRKEIASWLREAAKLPRDSKYEEIFEQRAALVESMRCETCKWNDEPIEESVLCLPLDKRFNKNFGCFHHEQKPAG